MNLIILPQHIGESHNYFNVSLSRKFFFGKITRVKIVQVETNLPLNHSQFSKVITWEMMKAYPKWTLTGFAQA